MNRFLVFFMLLAAFALTNAAAQAPAAAELSFSFTRLGGAATNQFAVWIENAQGQFVKTLYATSFTANGGWQKRPASIPVWVKQSGIAHMGEFELELDTITGATPKTGLLTYTWDGTDSNNTVVQPGDYVIFLEGTLRRASQVLYRAPIRLGQGPITSQASAAYSGSPGSEQKMIRNVVVRTLR